MRNSLPYHSLPIPPEFRPGDLVLRGPAKAVRSTRGFSHLPFETGADPDEAKGSRRGSVPCCSFLAAILATDACYDKLSQGYKGRRLVCQLKQGRILLPLTATATRKIGVLKSAIALPLFLTCLVFCSSCSRSASYYVGRGNSFFASKNYADAAIQYRKALQQDPNFADAQYHLGLVEIERGNAAEALGALSHAAELDPKNWQTKTKLADLCVSLMIAVRTQPPVLYNRVVAVSDEFLQQDPNSFDGLRLKGYIATLDRKPKEALEYFRRAHQTKRDDVVVSAAYAAELLNDGQTAEGESVAREVIAKKKDYAPVYDALYNHYLASNRAPAAEAILRQKIENNPNEAAYWVQLAGHFKRLEKTPEMTAALQKLLDNPKDFPKGKMIVGGFYAGIQRFDEATKLFQEGVRTDPALKFEYLKRLSDVQQLQGKVDEALLTVGEILKIKPDDEDSHGLQASLLLRRGRSGDRERAAEIFRTLVKKNPSKALWHLGLGRSLLDLGTDMNTARSELREALRVNSSMDLARQLLAEISIRQGKMDEALAIADEILVRKPNDVQARLLRVISLRGMKSFDAARRALRSLDRDFPRARELQFQFAALALAEGKYREASDLFQKLYQASPSDFRPLEGLVDTRLAQNQVADAIRLLDAELKKSPEAIRLRLILAATASRSGQPQLAAQQYEYLLQLEPKSIGLHLNLGDEQLKMEDPEKALATFQKANSLVPNNPLVIRGIAVALENAGRFQEAIQQHRRNLELDPENPVVQNNLAYLLAEAGGDLDEALRLIQQAVRKLPRDTSVADTLGWIYLKKNMTGSAQQVFAGLVKKDPRNPFFQYHLGSALYAQGDKDGARSALKAGLENKPPPLTEKKIRELLARLG
jgi:tetratricopeptide (TPR) repeat protein